MASRFLQNQNSVMITPPVTVKKGLSQKSGTSRKGNVKDSLFLIKFTDGMLYCSITSQRCIKGDSINGQAGDHI